MLRLSKSSFETHFKTVDQFLAETQSYLDVAIAAASQAGAILLRHFEAGVGSTEKDVGDQKQGLVTVADLEAEKCIIETIQKSFPQHAFLAEESLETGSNKDFLWVIDPLDGTNNFAHGIPHFGVSIAMWKQGAPLLGVVLDPLREELFVAVRGRGATLNGNPISVSNHRLLTEAMIATGFFYDRGELMSRTLGCMENLFRQEIRGIRRMGAASLDLAWVACGRYSAFFELTLSPWDHAAGRLIVTEAGGQFTNCRGANVGLEKTSVLASNGTLHDEVLALLEQQE